MKDKHFEMELSWVGSVTQGRHIKVPDEVYAEAERYAKSALEEDSDSGNDDMWEDYDYSDGDVGYPIQLNTLCNTNNVNASSFIYQIVLQSYKLELLSLKFRTLEKRLFTRLILKIFKIKE